MENKVSGASLNDKGGHLIMIVDDIKDNVIILKAFLARKKYRTIGAHNGEEALRLMREIKPDLILLDINMPGISGLEVCEEIRRDASLNNIGIILLTAASHIDDLVNGFNAGADDFLRKPFQHLEMLARVRSVINSRDIQERLLDVNSRLDNMNANLEQIVAEQVQELERVNGLKRYFSPQLVESFMACGTDEILTNERREVTVVFLDLRNFTSFAEQNDSQIVMQILSDFHETIGPIIFEFDATLERFTGDGLMCFLGAPQDVPDHAEKALLMSIQLQKAILPLTKKWPKNGSDLKLGIGMATGIASTGMIGFEGRLDYAAIGNVTNLAARLCSEALGGEILLAESTRNALPENKYEFNESSGIRLKGFSREFKIFSFQ